MLDDPPLLALGPLLALELGPLLAPELGPLLAPELGPLLALELGPLLAPELGPLLALELVLLRLRGAALRCEPSRTAPLRLKLAPLLRDDGADGFANGFAASRVNGFAVGFANGLPADLPAGFPVGLPSVFGANLPVASAARVIGCLLVEAPYGRESGARSTLTTGFASRAAARSSRTTAASAIDRRGFRGSIAPPTLSCFEALRSCSTSRGVRSRHSPTARPFNLSGPNDVRRNFFTGTPS